SLSDELLEGRVGQERPVLLRILDQGLADLMFLRGDRLSAMLAEGADPETVAPGGEDHVSGGRLRVRDRAVEELGQGLVERLALCDSPGDVPDAEEVGAQLLAVHFP